MAVFFISYGSNEFKKQLIRIGEEAKRLEFFDKIFLYTESDIPDFIKSKSVFKIKKGGGLWIWKAYIIKKTMDASKDGDILVYTDAGCSLRKSHEWKKYINYLDEYNAIFFQYQNKDYGWGKHYKHNSPQLKHWIKMDAINYLKNYFNNEDFLEYNKILAGAIIIKKTKGLSIIDEWYKTKINFPNLLTDELNKVEENPILNSHRHDQAILSALVYKFKDQDNLLVLPENSEQVKDSAILATRKKSFSPINVLKKFVYQFWYKFRPSD